MGLDAGRWGTVERLYHAVLARPADERPAFLAEACGGDDELRREVESLLAQEMSAAGVLTGGAVAAAAGLVSDIGHSNLAGRRIGAYQILGHIGTGGMGEVYRARDTRLGREVAIKILPPAFTADTNRLARFEREARVLASLNHQHIAAIYGQEDAPTEAGTQVRALILELVEGETLAKRITRTGSKGLPIEEALDIARQIADALDAAHEKGIVHRDLKPANIKITPQGIVKVLDFGLAKLEAGRASGADGVGGDFTAAPTITVDDTREGLIVGTAAYMSPEQARGQAVDRRTDIWSFGCVVYEMLTGRRPFVGDTVSDVIALTLQSEPDWSLLPSTTPSTVATMVRRCLEKDRTKRIQEIGEARLAFSAVEAVAERDGFPFWRYATRRPVAVALSAALTASAFIVASRWFTTPGAPAEGETTRLTVAFPPNQELNADGGAAALTISPDGRLVVYAADSDGRTALYARRLDAFAGQLLAGTDGARDPFFSPDGQWVAFFNGTQLMRVPLDGRSPVPVCDTPATSHGGTWGPDDTIVFDPGQSGLMRVAASGGRPEVLKSNDPAMDRRDFQWPQFLPDGSGLVATLIGRRDARSAGANPQEPSTIAAFSFGTRRWRSVIEGSQPTYVPPEFLVFHAERVHEGELQVASFDPIELTTRGVPVSFQNGVFRARSGGAAYFAISRSGTLVFAPGGYNRSLVRVDRDGRRTLVTNDRRGFRFPRLSPDGQHVAVTIDPRPSEIWIYDLERGTRIPLTRGRNTVVPVWTSDGRQVVYTTGATLYVRAADASSPEQPLVEATPGGQYAHSASRDGRFLFFHRLQAETRLDLWVLPTGGMPRSLLVTSARELHPAISPDGHWLAYDSDESGRSEIYIRPFPQVDAHKWPISAEGGHSPL